MVILSTIIGIVGAVSGYWVAHAFDISIAGSMATLSGIVFLLAFLLAPSRGLIAIARRRARQKWEFAVAMLAIHLFTHEDLPEAATECRADHLTDHLNWSEEFAANAVQRAIDNELVERKVDQLLMLTGRGRQVAKRAMVDWVAADNV
jgi:manganese/zinc/iron transport system permease protein